MRNSFLLLFAVVLLSSCKNDVETDKPEVESKSPEYEKLSEMKWLLGEWINKDDGMISKETWSKKNDNTYTGFSFRLLRKDTVFAEKMLLQQINGDLLLTVTTVDQNQEDDPVSFKLISSNDKQFVFENKRQEFPKRIAYVNKGNNSLHAWIEGSVLGENKKIDFHFSRKE